MTMSTPITTPGGTAGTSSPRTWSTHRRWVLAGAAVVALAAATSVVALDGSSSDPTPIGVTRSVEAGESGSTPAGPGLVSADAADRRASAAVDAREAGCSGLAADAAERCMRAG